MTKVLNQSKGRNNKKCHKFFLNPYLDCAFTKCPKCETKTKVRKFPLAIHIEPQQMFILNKQCKYCPYCDLIIAKQQELESLVIHTSPSSNNILPVRPVVYVASAQTVEAARIIHGKLWNLGTVPFLLILLPDHIRVYTGFAYSQHNENEGLIDLVDLNLTDIRSKLSYIFASSIDSGTIWQSQAKHLIPEKRVNIHLLKNLQQLSEYLVNHGLHFSVAALPYLAC